MRIRKQEKILIAFVQKGEKPVYALIYPRWQKNVYRQNEIDLMETLSWKPSGKELKPENCYDYDYHTDAFYWRGHH